MGLALVPLWRPGGLCVPFPSFRGNVNATKGPAGGPRLVWFWSKIQTQHGTPQHFSFKTSKLCRTFPPGRIRSPRRWSEMQGPRPQDSRPPTCSPGWARTTVDRGPSHTHTHTHRQWPRWPFIYTPDARLRASTGAKCTDAEALRPLDGGPWWPCHGLQSPLASPSLPLSEASLHRLPLLH